MSVCVCVVCVCLCVCSVGVFVYTYVGVKEENHYIAVKSGQKYLVLKCP